MSNIMIYKELYMECLVAGRVIKTCCRSAATLFLILAAGRHTAVEEDLFWRKG
jgi:hypothetical protein